MYFHHIPLNETRFNYRVVLSVNLSTNLTIQVNEGLIPTDTEVVVHLYSETSVQTLVGDLFQRMVVEDTKGNTICSK
jgi:hypothetical protein